MLVFARKEVDCGSKSEAFSTLSEVAFAFVYNSNLNLVTCSFSNWRVDWQFSCKNRPSTICIISIAYQPYFCQTYWNCFIYLRLFCLDFNAFSSTKRGTPEEISSFFTSNSIDCQVIYRLFYQYRRSTYTISVQNAAQSLLPASQLYPSICWLEPRLVPNLASQNLNSNPLFLDFQPKFCPLNLNLLSFLPSCNSCYRPIFFQIFHFQVSPSFMQTIFAVLYFHQFRTDSTE